MRVLVNEELRSARLVLRELAAADLPALSRYDERNRRRFERFAPERTLDTEQRERNLAIKLELRAQGSSLAFGVFEREGREELTGLVSLDALSGPPRPSGSISYSIDGASEGRGLASEAVALVVAFAFDELGLDRLEATVDPENARSRRLLERAGFDVVAELLEIPPHLAGFVRPQVLFALTRGRSLPVPASDARAEGDNSS